MNQEDIQKLIEKSEQTRTYMRLYKQKKYKENPEAINKKNRAYYYKNKCGLDAEVLHKYDTLLPCVAKIKLAVDEFKQNNIDLSIEYLTELVVQLRLESIQLRNMPCTSTTNLTEVLTNNLCI